MKYSEEKLNFAKSYFAKQGRKVDLTKISEEDRVKMLNAFRSSKKRALDSKNGDSKVSTTFTAQAHEILSNLAKKDSVTMSQWIVNNLQQPPPYFVTASHEGFPEDSTAIDTSLCLMPKIIVKSEVFNIDVEFRSRLSVGTMIGHLRNGQPEKREIYDAIMACREEIKLIGKTYEEIIRNPHFGSRTIEDQCILIAGVLESRADGESKYPPRIEPNTIAAELKKWFEEKEKVSAA